jgi:hypothetical protein
MCRSGNVSLWLRVDAQGRDHYVSATGPVTGPVTDKDLIHFAAQQVNTRSVQHDSAGK